MNRTANGTANGAAIECRNLSKSFGKLAAVRDLDLEIASGEIFGLLGPNGSGKTTTLNMVAGLLRPTLGDVIELELTAPLLDGSVFDPLGDVAQVDADGFHVRVRAEEGEKLLGQLIALLAGGTLGPVGTAGSLNEAVASYLPTWHAAEIMRNLLIWGDPAGVGTHFRWLLGLLAGSYLFLALAVTRKFRLE